jgi:hypothetical protein
MKNQHILIPIVFGITASSFAFISNPASAANLGGACTGTDLGVIRDQGQNEDTFKSNCATVTQLGKIQGRSGVLGFGDYEVAIGPNGAQAGLTGKLELDWNSGTTYKWQLDFNPSNNQAKFTLFNNGIDTIARSITYSYAGTLPFNAFGLIARADDSSTGIITAGTKMNLSVTDVTLDGTTSQTFASPLSVTAISNTLRFAKNYYTVDTSAGTEITQLKGTFSTNLTGLNPQDLKGHSRGIGFEITLFDPDNLAAQQKAAQSVSEIPEPNSILGLLIFGFLGIGSALKCKRDKK